MPDRKGGRSGHFELTGGFVCPTCKRPVAASREGQGLPRFFPFCSERCKLIDLGAWFNAEYRIPVQPEENADDSASECPSVPPENPAEE